jgi:ABC-type uncharacterized transport system permease subunit
VLRVERRLSQPRWLSVAVPLGSLVLAFGVIAIVLAATHAGSHYNPWYTYRRLFDAAFVANGALSETFVSATPLLFTGLAAAAAVRMNLFNIGAEGQLYLGVVGAVGAALLFSGTPGAFELAAMCVAGAAFGAIWAAIPGVLRAFGRANEIITTLMLNYVAGLAINYLIFDTHSYWRDTKSPSAAVFPQGQAIPDAALWPFATLSNSRGGVLLPLGLIVAAGVAVMRMRRKILAVMALSGGIAGLGGAAQAGNFDHLLDPRGLQQSNFGYSGIVVAALARYNPFAVVLIAILLGGLRNAGFALQGSDFPSGLVGVMQGIFLFCVLGGELLIRYRLRFGRERRHAATPASAPEAVR